MRAVILAGGSGTRGRPYTEYIPKAMIPACGRPLIGHVVDYLGSCGAVDGISIVADLAGTGGQIRGYLGEMDGVSYVQDSQSGTAGDLLCAGGLDGEDRFLLWFADNLCALDVGGMARRLAESGAEACVATRTRRREETGFARVEGGVVREFVEKPVVDLPHAECLGMYVLSGRIIGRIRALGGGPANLSYDVLQPLASEGQVCAFDIGDAGWVDAESPAALERNRETVGRITAEMARGGRPRRP